MNPKEELGTLIVSAMAKNGVTLSQEDVVAHIMCKDLPKLKIMFPCFWLARTTRKAPAVIAKSLALELAESVANSETLASVESVGPYLNVLIKGRSANG